MNYTSSTCPHGFKSFCRLARFGYCGNCATSVTSKSKDAAGSGTKAMNNIAQIQAECDCPKSYYLKCQAAGRCLEVKAGEMIDDPHDTGWDGIPQKPDTCPRCRHPWETCECIRRDDWPPGSSLALACVVGGLIIIVGLLIVAFWP